MIENKIESEKSKILVCNGGTKIIIRLGQKKLQHIYSVLHKKFQTNNKKNLKKLSNL